MLYLRKGVYYYDFCHQGQRYRGSTGFSNQQRAEMFEGKKRGEVLDGKLGIRRIPTLKEYSKKFIEYIDTTKLSLSTKKHYKNGVRILLESKYGAQKLDAITGYTPSAGINNPTANSVVSTLSRLLHLALEEKLIKFVPRFKHFGDHQREYIFSPDEANKIVTVAPQPLRDAFLCVWQAGMRPDEVVRMKVEDLDLNNRVLQVQSGKTKNARRLLPVSDRLLDMFVMRLAMPRVKSSGWMFPSQKKNGHITTGYIQDQFRKIVRPALGLPAKEAFIYCARHTFGTLVYDETQNLKTVMVVMGHSNSKTTMRYMHPETVESVRDALHKTIGATAATDIPKGRTM